MQLKRIHFAYIMIVVCFVCVLFALAKDGTRYCMQYPKNGNACVPITRRDENHPHDRSCGGNFTKPSLLVILEKIRVTTTSDAACSVMPRSVVS